MLDISELIKYANDAKKMINTQMMQNTQMKQETQITQKYVTNAKKNRNYF